MPRTIPKKPIISKFHFCKAIAEATGIPQKKADAAFKAALKLIVESVANDKDVFISGFGTFKSKQRKERLGRNPKNGAVIRIAARKSVTFKAHKAFLEAVRK